MAKRFCETACPTHGHWCDQELPHENHRSMEICQCIWDDNKRMLVIRGTAVEARPWRPTRDIPLPEPTAGGGEST